MTRKIGVNTAYLVKFSKDGFVAEAIKFVDDYRPALNIDRRYAKTEKFYGCIWYNDLKSFNTKEEGNEFFKQLKAEGFVAGTEAQYDELVDRAGRLTY